MSPSLEDAALLGKNVFQVIIDASPIGLPFAGIVAAFVLSKSGIQQREDLRTEVIQVQTNIVKKSEEADLAGKASTVRRVGTICLVMIVSFLTDEIYFCPLKHN